MSQVVWAVTEPSFGLFGFSFDQRSKSTGWKRDAVDGIIAINVDETLRKEG